MSKTTKKTKVTPTKKPKVTKKNNLKNKIRRIPEFKGVVFWDITTLLKDPAVFKEAIKQLAKHYKGKKIDAIVSNEARGFIIGAPLAYELGVAFVPIRKKGKLPYKCLDYTYKTEYSTDSIQIHEDAIKKGQKVLIIDDLLATGGTVKANVELVEKLGGKVAGCGFLIELEYLDGRKALGDKFEVFSLVNYKTPDDV